MEKLDISIKVGEHMLNYRVGAIIKNEDKILVHHSIGKEHYTLPGGRVKEGESSIDALQREIKEEMALDTEYVRPVSFIENFFEMNSREYHELLIIHEIKFKDREAYNKDSYEPVEEHKKGKLEFLWLDVKDIIDGVNFVPESIKKILKNNTNDYIHMINDDRHNINKELQEYIENSIFPEYQKNGKAHGIEHIKSVINRAMEIAKNYNVNYDILYTAASYHDIGDHIDREHHEIISAKIMWDDKKLDTFFSKEDKKTIKEAIEDHRASFDRVPRSIYGKILTSADKNTDKNEYFERSLEYGKEHFSNLTKQEHLDRVYQHAVEKFGINGYATKSQYVKNRAYDAFLKELQELIENKKEFYRIAGEIFEKLK